MNFKKIIATVAPFIGAMIAGPFGAAAGKILGSVLCGDENASQKRIEKAFREAKPETLLELKKVDAQTEKDYLDAGITLEQIEAADRHSARDMQKETKSIVPAALTILLTIGFFGTLFAIMFIKMQPGVQSVVDIMLGAEATAWIQCVSYWFGSSSGSKLKTAIMGKVGE